MLSATHIGLYLLFLTVGILGGFMIGLATDRRKPKRTQMMGEYYYVGGGGGGGTAVDGTDAGGGGGPGRPPAPEKPQWLRDAERGEADDIERMSAAPPPYYGGPHLTGSHRSH